MRSFRKKKKKKKKKTPEALATIKKDEKILNGK